jgi:flagellar hook-associated protein 3 FlgL
MIRNLRASDEVFLSNLQRLQDRMSRAQREITSGVRVSSPSDSPDQISDILQLRSSLLQNEQLKFNLGRAQSELDSADQALQSAVLVLDRAKVLATQGASSTTTPQQKMVIAQELRGLHESLINLSRTTVEGRYIFSGDADTTPAYALDPGDNTGTGATRLTTAEDTRYLAHPSGAAFQISRTARQIFDATDEIDGTARPENAFRAVNELRAALEADDPDAIQSAIGHLRLAADHVNQQLAFYGATQNRIRETVELNEKYAVSLKTELSHHQDADLPTAALELAQARYQQEAAMSAQARMPRSSLFEYLK